MGDAPLSGERLNEERAFIKRYTEGLAGHKVEYPADFSTPLEDRPRKVAVIGVPIADPPEVMDVDQTAQDTSLNLTVKSLKPPLSFKITAQVTDTIQHLKTLVAQSSSTAPAADTQRLLLKGKALTDSKLVKEYSIPDGATLTLMLKPSTSTASPIPTPAAPAQNISPAPSPSPSSGANIERMRSLSGSSNRPPTLTITTEVEGGSSTSQPVTDANIDIPPSGPPPQVSSAAFHRTISDPTFWQKIHALCVSEFVMEDDADSAWENFLMSMKGRLSAGEAAKIRDVVGVNGMGGGA